jgi:hypothetical protein
MHEAEVLHIGQAMAGALFKCRIRTHVSISKEERIKSAGLSWGHRDTEQASALCETRAQNLIKPRKIVAKH